tara:strand:+ start:879 stop:1190 length:312 start_codon:yes stop_codon:yes gene_type:complete
MINTGDEDIFANNPVMWDAPKKTEECDCGAIKGHPEGIIYPAIKQYTIEDEVERIVEELNATIPSGMTKEDRIRKALMPRRRVIGWALNNARPGEQLDVILKK